MNLAQLMTSPVITASPDTLLPVLLDLMEAHSISAVVLVDEDNKLTGIITERDIARHAAQDRLLSSMTGDSLMTEAPVTAAAETGYREAFQLMVVSGVRHIVVIDTEGRVSGIVTASNFLHSLGLEYFVELTGINEVISRNVISLSPSDSVHKALEKMRHYAISCTPVLDRDKPVGILTERDIICISQQKLDLYHTPLNKVMTRPVLTVPEGITLPDAVALLRRHRIRRLIVVNEHGRLTGLLTENDLLKGLQSKYSRLLREIINTQERQLRETRKVLDEQTILHNLLESAPDTGIAATDMNLRILYFNPVAAKIYGYKAEDVIGKTVHEFHVIHQIPAEMLDHATEVIKEKGFYEYSAQRQEQDGLHHFELRVSAIRNPVGKMIGYMLLAQDVTRRKKAELALQQSEKRLLKSQRFANAGSWDWQLANDTLYWSDRVPCLFGYEAGSRVTTHENFLKAVHPDDRGRVTEAVRACLEHGIEYEIEYRVIWADNTVHWLHEQGDVVRDEYGDPLNMLGMVQDVTRRKEAELQLRDQHRFLDSVIENIPSMLFVKDAEELRFVRFNRAGEKLTGRPAADFIGKSAADLLARNEAEALIAAEREVLVNKGKVEISEERITTRHQGIRLLRTRKVPILDERENPAYLLGISNDITEQKATEQSLAEARIQAEKANQSKSYFLANMSHEIRTPMNGIIGLTELALKTDLDAQQADYLQKVNQAAHSLLGLLNDILDLSKIEANRLTLESIPFDIHDLMAQIDSLMAVHSQQKGIPLHIHISPDIPRHLRGDPLRIKQILLNLVGNAFKFTKEGEVSITVRPGLHAQQGYLPLAFTVRDTGIGISREHQAGLFEAFIQFDSTTTRLHGGTGLGLAITKQLVEMMDGTIHLFSEPGQGSTFTFTLPLPASDQQHLKKHWELTETQGPDPAVLERIRGAKILLVEDNKINQQVAVELLIQEGFQVDLAENGRQALDMLEPGRYDLILMDLQMPVMDGYQAAAEIRKQKVYEELPVLAMSANAMSHDREQCLNVGMNDHIPKPVDCRHLLTALCTWIKPGNREPVLKPRPEPVDESVAHMPEVPGIKSVIALKRLGGNQSFYLNLLRSFAAEHTNDIQEIRTLLRQNQSDRAERRAHSLKGMAGAIGAEELQEACRILEDGIRRQRSFTDLLDEAEKKLHRIIAALQELPVSESNRETVGKEIDSRWLGDTLHLLWDRLEEYDAGTADTLNELLESTVQYPELHQLLTTLKAPVEQFDFAAALSILASFPVYGSFSGSERGQKR